MRSERVHQIGEGGPRRAYHLPGRRARRWTKWLVGALAAATAVAAVLAPAVSAQTQSNDATLRSLSFESDIARTRMFPAFQSDVTGYEVAVPNGETEVTVRLDTSHSGASVLVRTTPQGDCCVRSLQADAEGSYTLALRTGRATYVAVEVTAEDGTENIYNVYLNAAQLDAQGWRVYNDVPLDRLVDDPEFPSHYLRGVWAGDVGGAPTVLTTSWYHGPSRDQQLHVFNAGDSSRRTADDFALSGNPDAGIWSDGTKLWAMDSDGTLRVYNLSNGSEIQDYRTDVSPGGNGRTPGEVAPRGIWSDGSTLWVVDIENDKVLAFGLPGENCSRTTNYCRQSSKDFDLHADNGSPWGITANADTWWVTDLADDKIYAYTRSDDASNGTRDSDKDINYRTAVSTRHQVLLYGLSSTDDILYAAEFITNRVFSFNMSDVTSVAPELASDDANLSSLTVNDGSRNVPFGFDPALTTYSPQVEPDVTSVTVTASPSHSAATVKINGRIATSSSVNLGAEGTSTTVTVEVTAESGTKKTYQVTVNRRARSTDATLSALSLSGVPAEDLGFSSADVDYDVDVANGLTTTTVTATASVAASQVTITLGSATTTSLAEAALAVDLDVGDNVIEVVVTAENTSATETYTVTVDRDDPPPSDDATLSGLVLSDVTFSPVFSSATESYTASVANGVTSTTVTPTLSDSAATYVVQLGGSTDADGTVDLAVGSNAVSVVVTAEDGSTMKTYTVTVTRAQRPVSADPTLVNLELSHGTLNPTFSPTHETYTASVANGVESITVTPTLNSSAASYAITLEDNVDDEDIDLAVGANVIKVVVTAEDGSTMKTYAVTVTRAGVSTTDSTGSTAGGFFGSPVGSFNGGGSSNSDSTTVGDESEPSDGSSDDFTPYDDAGDAGSETEAAINALHRLGVFTGTECASNRFCPDDPLKRWMAAVWLVRLIDGDDPAAVTESRFADVNASTMWEESMWFAAHVERLADLEITAGCSLDPLKFCPDVTLTRAQTASWLARAFDLESDESQGFADADGSVHEDNINAVVAAGVMSGCSDDPKNFCLHDTVTKGEMARYVNAARNVSQGVS